MRVLVVEKGKQRAPRSLTGIFGANSGSVQKPIGGRSENDRGGVRIGAETRQTMLKTVALNRGGGSHSEQ